MVSGAHREDAYTDTGSVSTAAEAGEAGGDVKHGPRQYITGTRGYAG